MNAFLAELRRRKVIRVAAAYLVAAWVIMQVVNVATPALELPDWFDGAVFVLLAAGFLIALALSWVFELTPEGLKVTAPAPGGAPAPRLSRIDVVMIGALIALLGVSTVQVLGARPDAGRRGAVDAADLSIAVLPFADMSPDGDQEYFSDGLSEELLNVLAQIDELRVAGRTSSFAFKGRNEDLRTIGETLGVANILEGSVRKSGDRLRITAQLVSAADGYHLWSATYDRQLTDVFAVQEEIAMAVAEALSVTLGVAEAPVVEPEDLEVYDLYLRGLALVRNPRSPDDFLRAAAIFRGLIAVDPSFTNARVALAGTYVPVAVLFPERAAQTVAELEATVADALAQAPDDPGSHFANAILQLERQNWLEAERAFARAGSYTSSFGSVPYPGVLQLSVGRASEAADLLAAATRNDPLAQDVSNFLQQALSSAGRWDEAEAEYRRALGLDLVAAPVEHMALARVWSGGDDSLIRERFDRYIASQTVRSPLDGAVRAVYDDPAAALVLVRDAADDPDMQDGTRQLFVAIYAGHYGDQELAVAALRRSLLDSRSTLVQALWFTDLAAARRTPAFKALVRDLGLVDYWRATGNWGDFCRPLGEDDFECS